MGRYWEFKPYLKKLVRAPQKLTEFIKLKPMNVHIIISL